MNDFYSCFDQNELKKSYDKFPPEVQKIIDEMGSEFSRLMMKKIDEEIYQEMLQALEVKK